jgi:hypothetical protein
MKTSDLTGAALDWAVAKCEGMADDMLNDFDEYGWAYGDSRRYSTDWAQGGPIIEREAITVSEGSPVAGLEWMACDRGSTHIQHGPTYLIAAMRCYVASKLGDEVEIPKELL